MTGLTDAQRLKLIQLYRRDFKQFGVTCLRLRDMEGKLEPLLFNHAQSYLHRVIEEQKARTGMVRAIVLKGRKQGVSTYTGGRFYRQTSMWTGRRARVIAHKQSSSDDLFDIVKRFHDHNPMAPLSGKANEKELDFPDLDSGYKVGTAGSSDIGRGGTAQLLHASEFAFWPNANEHMAGIGNVVARAPGTEIIIESTGNGLGNAYHQLWQTAEAGEGDYIPIFIPWFWEPRYQAEVPKGFELSIDDLEYQRVYGLTLGQMAWRRLQILTYGSGFEWLFDQEFPATPALAFRSSTADPYISPITVSSAVNSGYNDRQGPLIIGVDPADTGPDRTAIAFRRGRVLFKMLTYQGKNTMETAGIVAKLISEYAPAAVFVDKTGIGAGIYDRLRELGHGRVYGVMFGGGAAEKEIYANKRAEMWGRMRDWLGDVPSRIPDDNELVADISAPSYRYDSSGRLLIEKKEDMRKRGVRSPDLADALALTFAEFVSAVQDGDHRSPRVEHKPASSAGY